MLSRRDWLRRTACGFGSVALTGLLHDEEARASSAPPADGRAKHVIMIFLQGGPSQMDTFDEKPELRRRHLQDYDGRKEGLQHVQISAGKLVASPWRFGRHGQSGLAISELFPHLARQADKLCVINSVYGDSASHQQGPLQALTGNFQTIAPALGAWTVFALGSGNRNLPAFVAFDAVSQMRGRELNAAYLPTSCQGTEMRLGGGDAAMPYLANARFPATAQEAQLRLIGRMNARYQSRTGPDAALEGIIESFELSARMQVEVPSLMDLTRETQAVRSLYGDSIVGRKCLLARRLVEAGVRFVQMSHLDWDHHSEMERKLPQTAQQVDQPIAALLEDLERRGLLDETLVVIGGEMGRLPYNPAGKLGRDHNGPAMTCVLAGGGVKRGLRYGATDELGLRAVENRVHFNDIHATMFHQLGINHQEFVYNHAGREYRINDARGRVLHDILR